MARIGKTARLSIKEICSRFFYEDYFRERNRIYERFNDCECDQVKGHWCSCTDSERCELHPQTLCQLETGYGDSLLHEEDGSVEIPRPLVARNRKIYPSKQAVRQGIPDNAPKSTFRDDCYEGVKNPYILIMNNVNFHTMPAPRGGAVADVDNLMEFFQDSKFRSIYNHYDLRRDEMWKQLQDTRANPALSDHDAFICVIMTHGDARGLKGVDDWRPNSIEVEEITSLFVGDKCPQLMTKPKLFFIQACRGDRVDEGYTLPCGEGDALVPDAVEKEMVVKLPSEADMLVAYSTTKHHVSYRKLTDNAQAMVEHRQTMGSWFISRMVQVFKEHSHTEDLMTMLTKVNGAMTKLYTGGEPESGKKQISCQLSMLTKRVYFAKYWEQQRGDLH